jgi:hypothetical protein
LVIDVARGGKLIMNAFESALEYVTYAFDPKTLRNDAVAVCIPLFKRPDGETTLLVATTNRFDVPTGIGSATNGIICAPELRPTLRVGVPVSDPAAKVCGTTKFATKEPVDAVALFDVVGARVAYARSHRAAAVVVGLGLKLRVTVVPAASV